MHAHNNQAKPSSSTPKSAQTIDPNNLDMTTALFYLIAPGLGQLILPISYLILFVETKDPTCLQAITHLESLRFQPAKIVEKLSEEQIKLIKAACLQLTEKIDPLKVTESTTNKELRSQLIAQVVPEQKEILNTLINDIAARIPSNTNAMVLELVKEFKENYVKNLIIFAKMMSELKEEKSAVLDSNPLIQKFQQAISPDLTLTLICAVLPVVEVKPTQEQISIAIDEAYKKLLLALSEHQKKVLSKLAVENKDAAFFHTFVAFGGKRHLQDFAENLFDVLAPAASIMFKRKEANQLVTNILQNKGTSAMESYSKELHSLKI